MRLIFDIQDVNEASSEINNALGFVDIDLDFEELKPEIKNATRSLIQIIGKTTYEAICDLYEEEPESEQRELIYLTQYYIGIKAYSEHAKSSDLAHTNNGRKMRSSEDEKTPFEWMLVRDDEINQKKAFKALDNLLEYLDEIKFTKWLESDEYIKSHNLFLRSTNEFSEYYQIESRLLLIKLRPGIKRCETKHILSILGQERFDRLKELRKSTSQDNNISESDQALILLIQEACVWYSLYWGLPRLQVTLLPEGVLQQIRAERMTVSSRKVPENMQVDQISRLFKKDADQLLKEIEDFIKPETPTSEDYTIDHDFNMDVDDLFVDA